MSISPSDYSYPFDPTGTAVTNRVPEEVHVITQENHRDFYFIIPKFAPFFAEGVSIFFTDVNGNYTPLTEGQDYYFGHHFLAASRAIGKQIYGSISFINKEFKGTMYFTYQTLGGMWTYDQSYLNQLMTNIISNPRIASWDSIVDLPATFPVIDHEWDLIDMVGMSHVVAGLFGIEEAIRNPEGGSGSQMMDHILNKENPHAVTKLQVGLGNVKDYDVATQLEAETGTATNKYMTPERVKQAITKIALEALQAHLDDTNDPHQVTKLQVGLGNVEDYAVATDDEAKAGIVTNKYMTPAKVKYFIDQGLGKAFLDHLDKTISTNPHGTTKSNVGLGSVQNYGIATQLEAETGTATNKYMTPEMTKYAIAKLANTSISDHIDNKENPHATTKLQVGLGNVEDYAVATQAEAEAGTATDKYMTPLLVKQAINKFSDVSNHITDLENPHETTASQVGAYTKSEVNSLLDDKLDTTATAADSSKFASKTLAEVTTYILSGKAADAGQLDDRTSDELKAWILEGKAADSTKIDGKTYDDLVAAVALDAAADQNFAIQLHHATAPAVNGATAIWTKIASLVLPGTGAPDEAGQDAQYLIAGGDVESDTKSALYLLRVSVRGTAPNQFTFQLQNLAGVNVNAQFGYVYDSTNNKLGIWIKTGILRNVISVTALSKNSCLVSPVDTPVVIQPSGIVYITEDINMATMMSGLADYFNTLTV